MKKILLLIGFTIIGTNFGMEDCSEDKNPETHPTLSWQEPWEKYFQNSEKPERSEVLYMLQQSVAYESLPELENDQVVDDLINDLFVPEFYAPYISVRHNFLRQYGGKQGIFDRARAILLSEYPDLEGCISNKKDYFNQWSLLDSLHRFSHQGVISYFADYLAVRTAVRMKKDCPKIPRNSIGELAKAFREQSQSK